MAVSKISNVLSRSSLVIGTVARLGTIRCAAENELSDDDKGHRE